MGCMSAVPSQGEWVVGMAWSQQGFVSCPEMLALMLLKVETQHRRVAW